jgi:hypothetical protein
MMMINLNKISSRYLHVLKDTKVSKSNFFLLLSQSFYQTYTATAPLSSLYVANTIKQTMLLHGFRLQSPSPPPPVLMGCIVSIIDSFPLRYVVLMDDISQLLLIPGRFGLPFLRLYRRVIMPKSHIFQRRIDGEWSREGSGAME